MMDMPKELHSEGLKMILEPRYIEKVITDFDVL